MRIFSQSFYEAAYDHALTFKNEHRIHFLVCKACLQFGMRILILRPIMILCCMFLALLMAVPVAVFISPSFTREALSGGVFRALQLFPDLWGAMFVAGCLFELVYVLRRLTGGLHE